MIFRRGMITVAAGLGVGLPVAWVFARLMSSLVFGVTAGDPATFVGHPAGPHRGGGPGDLRTRATGYAHRPHRGITIRVMPHTLIIGYGNPLRGDDGFGWHAALRLRRSSTMKASKSCQSTSSPPN